MKVSTKSSRVSPAQARVSTKSRSSRSNAVPVRSKNHLAWYVPLDTKRSEKKTSHIRQIKWKCPPKIALNTGWLVAAGEGSQEAEALKCRESALSEVVYTDLTAIPPCPFTSPVVEGECHDDTQTPIIPIIPIEEVAEETPSDSSVLVNTSINPQPSADLPISECDPSQVQELCESLPNNLLEIAAAAAATVAAAIQNKDQIDTELLIKFLSNPEMIRKVMNGNGFTSKPEEKEAAPPPPPPPKAIVSSPLPSLVPAPVVDKLINGGKKPVSKAIVSISKTEPVNRPLLLPCSEVETEINKVNGNGVTFKPEKEKAPPPPPPKAIISLPLPSLTPAPVVDKPTNGGKKPVRKTIMPISKTEPVNGPLLLPCSKVETEIKNVMNGNGFTFKPEEETAPPPPPPKAIVSSPLPSLAPASVVDKLTNGGNKPVSKAIPSISKPEPVNRPLLLPCSKVETEIQKVASKPSEPKHTPNAAKEPTHSSTSFNLRPNQIAREHKVRPPPPSTLSRDEEQIDRLVKKYGGPHITGPKPMDSFNSFPSMLNSDNQIAREQRVRPLLASTLRHNEKIDRLVKKYGGPHITGPKPMNPFNSPPSMLNSEAAKKMIHDYGAPDAARVNPSPPRMEEIHRTMEKYLSYNHGWRNPFMTPTPPLLAPTASPRTGTFHPSFTPMTREVDLEYHKSLIEKHGGIHESMEVKVPRICQSGNYLQGVEWSHKKTTIESNLKLPKPCIYFTSPRGCRNGQNCLFQHNVPEQWKMAQVNKKMKWN